MGQLVLRPKASAFEKSLVMMWVFLRVMPTILITVMSQFRLKPAKVIFWRCFKKDLGFSYTIGNATADLPDSFSSDALVIIGQ